MFNKNKYPKLYSEHQLDIIENHIEKHFGKFNNVLHEIVSPDIHVDICMIEPNDSHDCYTLVTMGAGAHKMSVPKECKKYGTPTRAEFVLRLPKEWEINNSDEKWYWPIGWLKTIARLPIANDTWLGYGHTVSNGGHFSDNTELSGALIEYPRFLANYEDSIVTIGKKEAVQFYQIIPIYEEEMNYKMQNDAEALTDLFDDKFSDVVCINRKNYCE